MLRLFGNVVKRVESDRILAKVIELNKSGQNLEALSMCEELVKQYPFDVQIRHRLALLQKETGQEIHLPDITPKNSI